MCNTCPCYYGDTPVLKQFNVSDVTENFHVYGVEWTPKELRFFVDDTFYFTYAPEEKTMLIGLFIAINLFY